MSVISMQRLNCSYRLQKIGILSLFRTDGRTEKTILVPVPAAGNAYSSEQALNKLESCLSRS
jgi:hypothetical protein